MTPKAGIAALCRQFADRFGPNALRLARVCSLAARVESALVRRLRLALVPEAAASAEADLWFSALVESWGPEAFVLRADVADWLREQLLLEHRDRAFIAHEIVDELHRAAPETLRLEEAAVWVGLVGGPKEREDVEKRLRNAVRTMVLDKRLETAIARWASRALPRLPSAARRFEPARLLAFGAAARLPARAAVEGVTGADGLVHAPWLLPSSMEMKEVRVARTMTGLTVVETSSITGAAVPVPATMPPVLEVTWREGNVERQESIIAEPGTSVEVPPDVRTLTLRTLAGESFELNPEDGISVGAKRESPEGSDRSTASESATLVEFRGHAGSLNTAKFSPDGQRVVTASQDKTARVWDANTGALITELKGHTADVRTAQFSRDGLRVVTASQDKTARVWDANTGALIVELRGHTAGVSTAQFSPDGSRVVTASGDKTARIWDAATGFPTAVLRAHAARVRTAQFSPDGSRVVTASQDSKAWVWDASTAVGLAELMGHRAGVRTAQFSPDGRCIVTASQDKTARVWDVKTGAPIAELKGHPGGVGTAQFSPDGSRVVTAGQGPTARVWDFNTGALIAEFKGHTASVKTAEFSPDGLHIVTASQDSTARVWNVETRALIAQFDGHIAGLSTAEFSPDGQWILTASSDTTARVQYVARSRPQDRYVSRFIRRRKTRSK